MFHLLLRDLSQELSENCMHTRFVISLTSKKMKEWEKMNDSEVADEEVSK